MAGLSLRDLSDALGGEPSHTQIAKFEAGEVCPDSKQLARFSQILHVRPDYFFKKDGLKLETVEYRSQTKLGSKGRKRLEEQALDLEIQIETAIQRLQWRQDNLDRGIKELKGDY